MAESGDSPPDPGNILQFDQLRSVLKAPRDNLPLADAPKLGCSRFGVCSSLLTPFVNNLHEKGPFLLPPVF